jgi:hypothetical protein
MSTLPMVHPAKYRLHYIHKYGDQDTALTEF